VRKENVSQRGEQGKRRGRRSKGRRQEKGEVERALVP